MPEMTKCIYLHFSIKKDADLIMLMRKHIKLKGKVSAKNDCSVVFGMKLGGWGGDGKSILLSEVFSGHLFFGMW